MEMIMPSLQYPGQAAYYPIMYITSLAFADDAFENTRGTSQAMIRSVLGDEILQELGLCLGLL
jgi:hypothetical protein